MANNVSKAVKQAMKERKMTQSRLASILGYASQSGVARRLQEGMTTDTLIKFLEALDYEVVIQPKSAGRRKDNQILLKRGEE